MSIGIWQIIFLAILIVIWFAAYAIGNYVCQKNIYLRKNTNKNSIILISLILFPIVMAITKEGFYFGLGFILAPFLLANLIHWLYPKIIKNNKIKSKKFYNENYYYGYLGFIFLAIINLLTYLN